MLGTKPNFSLTGKCFPLINFSNDKQTQESLESNFQKTFFRQTNEVMVKFMNLLPGKEKNMMEKIRCRDELGEMRGREKRGRRGAAVGLD